MDTLKSPVQNEEDDDAWLYGNTNEEPHEETNQNEQNEQINGKDHEEMQIKENDDAFFNDNELNQENGHNDDDDDDVNKNEDKNADEDEDSDDDDDNINVVIGDIVKKPLSPSRQNSKTGPITSSTTVAAKTAPTVSQQSKGVDVEGQGMIGDVPTYDFDLSSLRDEDKPWRKPGADITDYFNYGFNEETWIAYCLKQKKLRAENLGIKMVINPAAILGQPTIVQPQVNPVMQQGLINAPTINPALVRPQFPRPMIPINRKTGIIDVIGTTETTSRRPAHEMEPSAINQISVIGNPPYVPQQHVDLSAPPPGWTPGQPRMAPPPPQPRMTHPMQMNYPPYPNMQAQFMQQPTNYQFNRGQNMPPTNFQEPTRRSRSGSPNTPSKAHSRSKSPSDNKHKDDRRYRDSHRDRDRRSSSRSRYRSDRHRDYDRRDRKSRSRERSRSRSRDDKYKRSRRRSGSDDDYRSSKSHKRSHKKSRRNRDSQERDNTKNEQDKNSHQNNNNNNLAESPKNDQQSQK